jgi:hypothetical protein
VVVLFKVMCAVDMLPCISSASERLRMSITQERPAHSSARLTEGASGKATTLCVGCVGMIGTIGLDNRAGLSSLLL